MDIRRFYYIPLRPTDTSPNLGEDFYKFTLFVKIRFFAMQITPFCRDFVHAQHNSSKLGSAFAYHKIRSTDDTDCYFEIALIMRSATFLPERSIPPKIGPIRGVPLTAEAAIPQT